MFFIITIGSDLFKNLLKFEAFRYTSLVVNCFNFFSFAYLKMFDLLNQYL